MPQSLRHLLLLASLWLGLAGAAQAADLITERAWFEDKTGALSFEQAKQQDFKPYQGVLSRGIGKGAIWLRLTVDPSMRTREMPLVTDRAVLRIRPAYLDTVTLYDPLQDLQAPRVSGDLTPVSQDEYQSLNLNFVIPKGEASRELYLRIETTSTRMVDVQAFTLAELQKEDQGLLIFSGLYMGVGALFLFWAITTWLATKDRVVFSFVFSQLGSLLIGLSILGFARFWLSDTLGGAATNQLASLCILVGVLAACWFYLRLISEFKPPAFIIWIHRLGIGLVATAIALFLLGEARTAVKINWATATLLPLAGVAGALLARGWKENDSKLKLLPRPVLLSYYGSILVLMIFAGSAGFGLFANVSAFTVYASLTNGVVSGALAVAFLQYRVNLTQKYQNQILTELAVSKKAAEQERAYRLDQDRLLTMLAHEVKTPLSVISIALGTQAQQEQNRELVKNAVRDIRDIINQCLEVDTLNSSRLRLNVHEISFSEVLEEMLSRLPGLPERLRIKSPTEIKIKTDPRLLRIIMYNLLDNAQRYADANTPIALELSQDNQGEVTLTLCNAPGASGLPDPDRLFDKYYRSAGAHRISGTGLGLYLSRELAQKLGGSLRYAVADSQLCFNLCIPQQNSPA